MRRGSASASRRAVRARAQENINELLIEHARQGRRVVRLKGGDPFVFGRGGEELEALARAGINFSVVPGITAATGCAAYAGIPLTHREHAHSVSFVTGHADPRRQRTRLARAGDARSHGGFLHGTRALGPHRGEAARARRPADRPAALIAQGTTREPAGAHRHSRHHSRNAAAGANLQSPALLVVGDVVALHSDSRVVQHRHGGDLFRPREASARRLQVEAHQVSAIAARSRAPRSTPRLNKRDWYLAPPSQRMVTMVWPGPDLPGELDGGGNIDSRRTAEQQSFLAQQAVHETHGFRIRDSQRIVDRRDLRDLPSRGRCRCLR